MPPIPLSIDAPVSLLTIKLKLTTITIIIKLIALAYWFHPFSLYWNRSVVRILVDGETKRINRESSLIQEINGSRYPDRKLDF